MPQTAPDSLVDALVHAHASHTSFATRPELIPASLPAAMAVQTQTLAAMGVKLGGWKVGFNTVGLSIAGPMIDTCIRPAGGTWPLTEAGPIVVEVEIAVRLKHDLPPRFGSLYTREEILAAISYVLPGLELIQSRLKEGMAAPFPIWLADRLGNAGYICGPQHAEFASLDLAALRCRLWVDGKLVHDKTGGHPQTDPLLPLVAWANAQNDGLGGLKAGQIITTGSLTVPLPCTSAVQLEAEIEGLGPVAVRLAAS